MKKKIFVLFLVIVLCITTMLPVSANEFKASEITVDTLYDNGILIYTANSQYKTVTNLEVVKALYRVDLLCDYHMHNNKEIEVQTTEQALFWMYSCLDLPEEFLEKFNENDNCTRETMAVLFYYFAEHLDFHLFNFDKNYLTGFSDYLTIPDCSKTAISWALQNKIMPEIYDVDIENAIKIRPIELTCSTGYSNAINITQLETYFVNYFLHLEMSKTYGEELVEFARQFLGYDYIWGGCTKRGFDCSGFVYYVFENSGYDLGGHRSGAHAYSTRYGTNIMKKCLDMNGNIDWDKVPMGAVIGFDWEFDGSIDHVGIWTGESLLHARGGPNKQYARNGYMVCEYFEEEGYGLDYTFDYELNAWRVNHIVAIRSFEKHRVTEDGK